MHIVKAVLLIFLLTYTVSKPINAKDEECIGAVNRYVFTRVSSDGCDFSPRGATTIGGNVIFNDNPRKEWLELQEKAISKFEQDRRAILAMQGGYKVNFDFLETVGFSENYKPDRPYQSWGTEYVYLIKNEPEFISLQHILVMKVLQDDGSLTKPIVIKHWRQDWTYQDTTLLEYSHSNIWAKNKLSKRKAKGLWSQAVFQVDDSPRYESYGQWKHNPSFSSWQSQTTRRPLPRREHSVRDDYHVLEGTNRHTITQYGWVQEEDNWKLVLDNEGKPSTKAPYLSKEEGLAQYRAIKDFDFSAGDEYFEDTDYVWAAVRKKWRELENENDWVGLKEKVEGLELFVPLFSLANDYADNEIEELDVNQQLEKIMEDYLILDK